MKIGLTLASKIALGTSCALFWVSKKKCFSNALRHTLVVLEMH